MPNRDIESIRIEKANNGYTVRTSYTRDPKDSYEEPEMTVHESSDGVLGMVKGLLTGKVKSPKAHKMLNDAAEVQTTRMKGRY